MSKLRFVSGIGVAFLFALLAIGTAGSAHASEVPVSKLFTADAYGNDRFVAITNTGTINAENRLFFNTHLSDEVKTLAMTEVFIGATESGMLVDTTLVPGDRFFALDEITGYAVVVDVPATESLILQPPKTGITRWSHPGGDR